MIANIKTFGASATRENESSGVAGLGSLDLLSQAFQVPSVTAGEGNGFLGVEGIEADGALGGFVDEG